MQTVCVLPQVDGADVSLNASGSTQHLATVLPQALEHHLHGVLQETHSTSVFRWRSDANFRESHATTAGYITRNRTHESFFSLKDVFLISAINTEKVYLHHRHVQIKVTEKKFFRL